MNSPTKLIEVLPQTVEFKLDGNTLHAYEGETILKAAKRHGIDIPHLCYKDGYRADGNCRACVVEVKGERVLAPSCCRSATAGMDVQANSPRALKSQKMVVEMLLSDMPDVGYKWTDFPLPLSGEGMDGVIPAPEPVGQHGELSDWAARLNITVRPELKALRRE
ncbi:MAG: (2Fe-2S)-binding protein, partial [Chitinophagaceae bacterium]|nr:(2Fe-2S)-binding protein [Polaromonas sp.]